MYIMLFPLQLIKQPQQTLKHIEIGISLCTLKDVCNVSFLLSLCVWAKNLQKLMFLKNCNIIWENRKNGSYWRIQALLNFSLQYIINESKGPYNLTRWMVGAEGKKLLVTLHTQHHG